jgi:hypothetical protein
MAIRKEGSSFTVSNNLKAALINAGFQSATLPQAGRLFFDGSATEVVLCLDQPGDTDGFRAITATGKTANNQIVDFDFIDVDDSTVTRLWVKRELDYFFGSLPGFSTVSATLDGSTWRVQLVVNGTTYNGSDSKEIDAYCKALTAAMNGQQAAMRAANGL